MCRYYRRSAQRRINLCKLNEERNGFPISLGINSFRGWSKMYLVRERSVIGFSQLSSNKSNSAVN